MYDYEVEKESIFSEKGQVTFLKVRDNVDRLMKISGAVRMQEALGGITGDSWEIMTCVDRLVELEEIKEITGKDCFGQHRIFIKNKPR